MATQPSHLDLPPDCRLPVHIGIIMDGNGRWARQRGLPRTEGHRAGAEATREAVRACAEIGIPYLTVYVFSVENWGRPREEVTLLLDLLVEMLNREVKELNANNVRLHVIGELDRLPSSTHAQLDRAITDTSGNDRLNLILALSYSGRSEIVAAARSFAREALGDPSLIDSLDEQRFRRFLFTHEFPDPELIIRTGGDLRISNFLLWQAAYAELHVIAEFWPDFNREHLRRALIDFNSRDRRFGKVPGPH